MKNAVILLAAIIMLPIISCKKKKLPDPTVQITNPRIYMQGAVGSYWIYQQYHVDSNNTETIVPATDSIFISEIKTINNKSYVHYTSIRGFIDGFFTDSGSYWIHENGERYFSTLESNVDLHSQSYPSEPWFETFERKVNQPAGFSSITTPASTFSGKFVNDLQTIKFSGKSAFSITMSKAYAKNIGLIMHEVAYVSGAEHKEKERFKLLRYHIAK